MELNKEPFYLHQYLRTQFVQYPDKITVDNTGAVSSIEFEQFKVNEDIIEEINKIYGDDCKRFYLETLLQYPGQYLSDFLFWQEMPSYVTRWTPNSLALILKEYLKAVNKKQALVFEMALPIHFNLINKHNEKGGYSTRMVTVSTMQTREKWFYYCLMKMLHWIHFSKKHYLDTLNAPTFFDLDKDDQRGYRTPEEYEHYINHQHQTYLWTKRFQCDLKELINAYQLVRKEVYAYD